MNVYNWTDYIAPNTIADFERETGIEVNYDLYDSTEIVEAKLLSGKTGYDVVFHGFRYSRRLIPVGVYQPLDRDRLGFWADLDPWVMDAMDDYDPGNRHGIPYMWGSTGFSYNTRLVLERIPDAPLASSAMLFDPEVVSKLADCGVSLLDEPSDVIPMVLLYLGHDPNSLDPAHLAEVEAQLKLVRPYIRYFSSARMLIDLPTEQICVAQGWSGEYATAAERAREAGLDIEFGYTVPTEGSMLWVDGVFIPADAPHPDNAHVFLNYLFRPEVIGHISNSLYNSNANLASLPYVRPEIVSNPAIYARGEERDRLRFGLIYGPKKERLRTRTWSRIKTGL